MKKKVLGIMMAAMTLLAAPAVAQSTQNGNNVTSCSSQRQECVVNSATCPVAPQDCAVNPTGNPKDCRRVCPYEGLNLTADQKNKLAELDARIAKSRKEAKASLKEDRKKVDSTKVQARKTLRKDYLDSVKAIVGPEQYVVFLENFFVNGGDRKGGKDFRGGKEISKDKKQHARRDDGRKKNRKDKATAGRNDNRQRTGRNASNLEARTK